MGRGNEKAIAELVQLLESTPNKRIRWQAAESLGKIDPGTEKAIAGLVQLLGSNKHQEETPPPKESKVKLLKVDPSKTIPYRQDGFDFRRSRK
ncbi:MAG: HEAT repeat domain-containing protein [Spirulina sp.]